MSKLQLWGLFLSKFWYIWLAAVLTAAVAYTVEHNEKAEAMLFSIAKKLGLQINDEVE